MLWNRHPANMQPIGTRFVFIYFSDSSWTGFCSLAQNLAVFENIPQSLFVDGNKNQWCQRATLGDRLMNWLLFVLLWGLNGFNQHRIFLLEAKNSKKLIFSVDEALLLVPFQVSCLPCLLHSQSFCWRHRRAIWKFDYLTFESHVCVFRLFKHSTWNPLWPE